MVCCFPCTLSPPLWWQDINKHSNSTQNENKVSLPILYFISIKTSTVEKFSQYILNVNLESTSIRFLVNSQHECICVCWRWMALCYPRIIAPSFSPIQIGGMGWVGERNNIEKVSRKVLVMKSSHFRHGKKYCSTEIWGHIRTSLRSPVVNKAVFLKELALLQLWKCGGWRKTKHIVLGSPLCQCPVYSSWLGSWWYLACTIPCAHWPRSFRKHTLTSKNQLTR